MARIRVGEFPVGSQLPTKAELMGRYGAALGTVERALAELRLMGVVESRQGSGTFVLRADPVAENTGQAVRRLASQLEDVADRLGKVEERLSAAESALRERR